MTLFLSALEREISFLRPFALRRHLPPGCFYAQMKEHSFFFAHCGMGSEKARYFTESILPKLNIHNLIFIGLAGGLKSSLVLNEILIAREVCLFSRCWKTDPDLFNKVVKATHTLSPLSVGRIVTLDRAIGSAKEACEYSVLRGADAVDMEAGVIATVAAQRKIPFVTLKSISDLFPLSHPSTQSFNNALKEAKRSFRILVENFFLR